MKKTPDLRYFPATIYDYEGLYEIGNRYFMWSVFVIMTLFPLSVFSLSHVTDPSDNYPFYEFLMRIDLVYERYLSLSKMDIFSAYCYIYSAILFFPVLLIQLFGMIVIYVKTYMKNENHSDLNIKSVSGTLGSAVVGIVLYFSTFLFPLEFFQEKYLGMRVIFIAPFFPFFSALATIAISIMMFTVVMFFVKLAFTKGKFSYD